jgi:hypothetical protein
MVLGEHLSLSVAAPASSVFFLSAQYMQLTTIIPFALIHIIMTTFACLLQSMSVVSVLFSLFQSELHYIYFIPRAGHLSRRG